MLKNKLWSLNQEAYCIKPSVFAVGSSPFIGCLVSLHWLFFYASIKYSNASVGVVCMSTISLFTSIIEPLFFGKKFKISEAFFASVVILVMYLVFYSASFYLTGIILGLIGALFSSVFTILNKKAVAKVSSQAKLII